MNKMVNLEFTGERFMPGIHGNIEIEHLHRYLQACDLAEGKVVLDIASGEGYGSAMLAKRATKVIGVDISPAAIKHARDHYRDSNLEFMVGNCADIPLADASVDLVVSFETIEHHDQHEEMMREIKRVLNPSGILVISSPDKYNYSIEPGYKNEFHIKELYEHELRQLLGKNFKNTAYSGQRVVYGSAIFSEYPSNSLTYWQEKDHIKEAHGLKKPLYWIALASDEKLPVIPSGLLELPVGESDSTKYWISQVSERDSQIANLNYILTQRDEELINIDQQLTERNIQLVSLNQVSVECSKQLNNIRQNLEAHERKVFELNLLLNASASRMQIDQCETTNDEKNTKITRDEVIKNLHLILVDKEAELKNLSISIDKYKWQVEAFGLKNLENSNEIESLKRKYNSKLIAKGVEIRDLQEKLQFNQNSHSWRITAPLRKITRSLHRQFSASKFSIFRKSGIKTFQEKLILDQLDVDQVRKSPLFNSDFYFENNVDLQSSDIDLAEHFHYHGWREHRDPSAEFSTYDYLTENPDIEAGDIDPLLHYLKSGHLEGRMIKPSKKNPSFFLIQDASNSPSKVADFPEVPTRIISSEKIDAEIADIKKSGLFEEDFYCAMYADLEISSVDAIEHYCKHGWLEGKNPSAEFDTNSYLNTYEDIRNAGLNPFWHYVVAGAGELRHAAPNLAPRFENDIQFGHIETDIKLLAFYDRPNWDVVRSGRPAFKGHIQPLLPHENLGLYDIESRDVLKNQAELARSHGLHGFCFNVSFAEKSDSVLPFNLFLSAKDIDFKFCIHLDLNIDVDLISFGDRLTDMIKDQRFISVDGRAVFLLTLDYGPQQTERVLAEFRSIFIKEGVKNPFLIGRLGSFDSPLDDSLKRLCDAVFDAPLYPIPKETGSFTPPKRNGINVVPYTIVAAQGISRAKRIQSLSSAYHAISLGRDNSVKKSQDALVYSRFHVKDYRKWLDAAIKNSTIQHENDRRFIILNSWNDWSEGLFLEPDRLSGYGRLNETTRALLNLPQGITMPKVSVIVPNFNHGIFLRRRLDSIYGQTYKNIEVILLDDCSSDDSRSILKEYAERYSNITLTDFNSVNSGSAFRQWAKGIKAATGDLIWIAESDDFCDEHFLEVLVRCFDDEAVMLAYAKCVFVDKHENLMQDEFEIHVRDLECANKWNKSYVETAHNEVCEALGIKNTVPNASGAIFKRPVNIPLLDDVSWLSMVVAGDWVFYLHIIHGGKIAYRTDVNNFFRRYAGSAAEVTYKKDTFYREIGMASLAVAKLYNVPLSVLERCKKSFKALYDERIGRSDEEFSRWYGSDSIIEAAKRRLPNVMVSTMGFFPGGAEILPIRLANEFKKQGLSVLLLNAGFNPREDGIRRMLRNDVPVIETPSVEDVKKIISDYGIEVLNTHQWHIQKYPLVVPDVFSGLTGHIASLHGMIEHGNAFAVTEDQLRIADQNVTTWVYTAKKNIVPFVNLNIYDDSSPRFVKLPNGMQLPAAIIPVSREDIGIPNDAFVLCCVSRAIPDKGWFEAIQVVERARDISSKDIRLILVGNGPIYDKYCRDGVPDFVYLAGFSEDSVGHYAASDMGIMLTTFKSESFPLTIVDCLFAGRPYIASDVGDIRNMLTTLSGVAGEVIELQDWEVPLEAAAQVVASFATDELKYSEALKLVDEVAARYHIDVVAAKYIEIFQKSNNSHFIGNVDPTKINA